MAAMRWLVVVIIVLANAGVARAIGLRICFGPPTGPILEAPLAPLFVVESHDVQPGETATAIDPYWSQVHVQVQPGDVFVRGIGCDRQRFRVTHGWKNEAAALEPTEIEVLDTRDVVTLRWPSAPQHSWTRVDWAYRAEDLHNDLHGSILVEEPAWQNLSEARLAVPPTVRAIHVRMTRYHMDGSLQHWWGWIDIDHARLGTGFGPAVAPPTAGPCTGAGRAVPTTPTFRTYGGDTPRFVAMTCDGRLLPVTRAIGDEPRTHVSTTVSVRDGERFWLRRLPLAPGAPTEPLLVATSDRYRDVAPVVTSAEPMGCSVELQIADEGTWDEVEVSSVAIDGPYAGEAERYRSLTKDIWVDTLRASPQMVRLTPIWGGQRGQSWFGWAHSERCDTASFGVAMPPAAAPTAPAVVNHASPPGPRAESSSRRPVLALLSLLGLGFGWLVLRRLASVV
ncbi:MAG TPA: hypothetical protein VIU61_21485 [Kofleriaceae bacterium]